MAFFSQDQLDGLSITRMIFHVVGPDPARMVLLEETAPEPFADFFLDRLKSTNGGLMFNFAEGSPLEGALRRVQLDHNSFEAETKILATQFQIQHSGAASEGAFMVFVLKSLGQTYFALVKYDHESVLTYAIQQTATRATALILHRRGAHMPLSSTLQESRSHSLSYAHVL